MRRVIAKVVLLDASRLYPAHKDLLVGDFGLATSSLAAVDPSDVSPRVVLQEADMTLGASYVGFHRMNLSCGGIHRGRDATVHRARGPIKTPETNEPHQSGYVQPWRTSFPGFRQACVLNMV